MLLFWGQIYNKYISVCVWVWLGLRRDQSLDSNSENRVFFVNCVWQGGTVCSYWWEWLQTKGIYVFTSILTESRCVKDTVGCSFSLSLQILDRIKSEGKHNMLRLFARIYYILFFFHDATLCSLFWCWLFEEAAVSACDLSPLNPVNILLFRSFAVVGGNNLFSGIYKWKVCFSPSIVCS